MNNPNVLIVFVKEPRPGAAKTRLTPSLSAADAAEVYRVLAEEEIRNTAPRPGEYTRLFFFDPSSAPEAMSEWLPEETLVPQRGTDLGARMSTAFDEAFHRGARRAAVIGTDVPWVTRALVAEAFAALGEHDVVLGPTADGGYYLLATDRPRPELFRAVAWSTSSVLASTVERAGALGLKVHMLRPLTDIDTIDDLRSHWDELQPLLAGRPVADAVARALRKA
jgi:rSAM/selenodomain-associated transferase 1